MLDPIAVYIHWPYCLKKCPYCDFNSHVANVVDHDLWKECYLREIKTYVDMLGPRHVTSIFFGGGTPSLMRPETVSNVINFIQKEWDIDNNCEITLEANPTSIEINKFRDFKNAGINRVSVGVQSLRDNSLKFLGREHSSTEAVRAIEIASTVFDRYNFDLIYARPGQSLKAWEHELTTALNYGSNHMSLYQLMVEDGTQFKVMREAGLLTELDGDVAADMYELTQKIMDDHGVPAYEISNHAKPGEESRHNMTYWRYGDYVGIGPGAHGRLTLPSGQKIATRTIKSPDKWLSQVQETGLGARPFEELDRQTQIEERLMMGLRLNEGVDISHLQFDKGRLKPLLDEGVLHLANNQLKIDRKYWPILDSVIAKTLLAL